MYLFLPRDEHTPNRQAGSITTESFPSAYHASSH